MVRKCLARSLSFIAVTLWTTAAVSAPIGLFDDFEGDALGLFPPGWLGIAAVDPAPPNPALPSAVVVTTTDAFGNPTKALALNDERASSQGIYRQVPLSATYTSKADVRIDRYGDTNTFTGTSSDWPIAVGINGLQGTTDPAFIPSIQVYASTLTQAWRFYGSTANTFADVPLAVAAPVGQWFTVELDVDIFGATARSRVTDTLTSALLVDQIFPLALFGAWDPLVDGAFNIEGFFDGELTGTTTAGMAVVDNIDQTVNPVPEPGTVALFSIGLLGLGVLRSRRGGRA